MKQSGIYKITSSSGKYYIGSAVNIHERWLRHKRDLRKSKHHSILLQRGWDKYGENNFKFEILELVIKQDLIIKEQYYMNLLKPHYNISTTAGSNSGRIPSIQEREIKRKIAIEKGLKPPESTWKDRQKVVHMLNDELGIIQSFQSLSEACRFVGKDHTFVSCITRAIKLKSKSYGYYWKYPQQ